MPNVPHSTHSRSSHRFRTRSTHDYDAHVAGLSGDERVADQSSIDGVSQFPQQQLSVTAFADTIRPVLLVHGLPTLPDDAYPEHTFVYDIDAVPPSLWKNLSDVWTEIVGPDDIQANSITAGQIAAGAISVSELAAGAVTTEKLGLVDASGTTLLSASGFGPTWQRFIENGLYNSDFQSPTASVATDIHNSTNPLPYWTYTQSSGTAVTARVVNDSALGSGHIVRFSVASGSAGDESYIEQIVPIRTVAVRDTALMIASSVRATTDSLVEAVLNCALLDSALSVISSIESTATQTFINADSDNFHGLTSNYMVPTRDAAYIRVRIGVQRGAAATSATGEIDMCDLRLLSWSRHSLYADNVDPTQSPARIFKDNSSLWIRSASTAPSDPTIELDNAGGGVKVWLETGGKFDVDNGPIVGAVKSGFEDLTFSSEITKTATVNFGTAFSATPVVVATVNDAISNGMTVSIVAGSISTSSFQLKARHSGGSSVSGTLRVYWTAVLSDNA